MRFVSVYLYHMSTEQVIHDKVKDVFVCHSMILLKALFIFAALTQLTNVAQWPPMIEIKSSGRGLLFKEESLQRNIWYWHSTPQGGTRWNMVVLIAPPVLPVYILMRWGNMDTRLVTWSRIENNTERSDINFIMTYYGNVLQNIIILNQLQP